MATGGYVRNQDAIKKKERAGVVTTAARLPETNSVKLLTQGLETFKYTLYANCEKIFCCLKNNLLLL